jgi:hypothetical protein
MTNVIQGQLIRLLRRKTIVLAAIGAVAFAALSAIPVFASAKAGGPVAGRAVTLQTLAGHGGGTQAFATAASFAGFFIFVSFIALMGADLSGGTFRALLLRDPRRIRVLAGQLVGILVVAAAVAAVAEVLTFAFALPMAAARDVPTSAWFSLAGAGAALGDFGTTLAVVFRSTPVALGIGFVWAGPFEHIVAGAWSTGNRLFPGLVLQSLIAGGTPDLALGPAVLTGILYVGVAAAASFALTATRDVTA